MIAESIYILQMKSGSQKAFEKLYQMYVRRLYGFCYQYTKSQEDSEEVIQDVFLKLWTNKEALQSNDTIQFWLLTATKNRLINLYRSRINSPRYEEYMEYCNQEKLSVNDTTYQIEYDDFCKQLEIAKQYLSDTQKKVFELSFDQQLSHKEIAARLSLNEHTVKNQVYLGLKTLREHLEKNIYLLMLLLLR